MKRSIEVFLQSHSEDGFVTISTCKKASELYEHSFRDVEEIAYGIDLTPYRYQRNQTTISIQNQKKLFDSCVAIIGCGGLGGKIAENLTRIGVGKLILFDFDTFEEHNLNRQNFSNTEVIGREKVFVVQRECQKINPSTIIEAHCQKFEVAKDFELLQSCNVIIDALDNPETKLELSFTCKKNNKHFIHGAIAGFNAQHSTDSTLEHLYRDGTKGIETSIGNPSFTVSYASALQSAECIKVLLGLGENLKGKILFSNILENEFTMLGN